MVALMSSLQKHSSRRSPFWFCKYRDCNGRAVVKSTKHKEKVSRCIFVWLLKVQPELPQQKLRLAKLYMKFLRYIPISKNPIYDHVKDTRERLQKNLGVDFVFNFF